MIKNYLILCISLLISILGATPSLSMGPVPLPYSNQSYQVNPTARMSPQQKTAISQSFSWAKSMVQHNHAYLCKTRRDCLHLDLNVLTTAINRDPNHPVVPFFKNVYTLIRSDAHRQKFVTQWVIFNNLSAAAQADYRNGIRVSPFQPQYVKSTRGTVPAFFSQDDVFASLLEEINHRHKNCEDYVTCLSGGLQIIKKLYNRLAPQDPVRPHLQSLHTIIKDLATGSIFDTLTYLIFYNPLSPFWNDTLKKHKARKLTAYGYKEWRQVQKGSRVSSWRAPRVTNGIPLTQNQSFRSKMEGFRPKGDDFRANFQSKKSSARDWWHENKKIFKGWW